MHHLGLSRRLSSAAVALSFLVANASHGGGANENAPSAAATQDSSQTGVEMIVRVKMISGDVKGEIMGSGTVGRGCGDELGRYLQKGDTVELGIEHIGVLRNRIA